MAKKSSANINYVVLIECRSDKRKKIYTPGEIVSVGDFPQAVIDNWLRLVPPVLAPENAPGGELEPDEEEKQEENASGVENEESEVTDGE